jgi:hypothetical protein
LDSAYNPAHALKCEIASEVLRSSGKLRLCAMGWSMLPSVMPGDTLLIERAEGNAVCEGDVVLFECNGRFVAHRVVRRTDGNSGQLLTRGDAALRADQPLGECELLGKVSHIVRDGKCIEVRRSLSLAQRAIAALARRSKTAARVVVGVHNMRRTSEAQA